jgi:LmbE family N-acetylglucosaminyl deacetylase
VHEAARVAARPVPGQSVKKILAYEALSETEWGFEPFVPNVYEDITDTLEAKMGAMKAYEEELKAFPHPRSLEAIEALAKKRGSEVGVFRAEAFMLIRSVQ